SRVSVTFDNKIVIMGSQAVRNTCKLFLPGLRKNDFFGKYLLAGDVGGTKTNLAFCQAGQGELQVLVTKSYSSDDFKSLVELMNAFFAELPHKPDRICLGVAGPVIDGSVRFTNLGWDVQVSELSASLQVPEVKLLNDLEATAYGLAAMEARDFHTLHEGHHLDGNSAIVAPGTGLGEAGLYFDGDCLHPFSTEGGHSDFSPRTSLDFKLYQYLEQLYGIVSWEKLISGPAIEDIFNFLCTERSITVPSALAKRIREEDSSAVISKEAIDGNDSTCKETMDLFVSYLARECTSMALKMKAVGGLYLAGGIPPKILPLLQRPLFMESFMKSDRMETLLEQVGIHVILNQRAPMLGAACYAAYGKW
ncbi:MAG TPA: glucokinase, partial [Flavitalea sp.]|nr:glucokinase [Flavitalea sp.]